MTGSEASALACFRGNSASGGVSVGTDLQANDASVRGQGACLSASWRKSGSVRSRYAQYHACTKYRLHPCFLPQRTVSPASSDDATQCGAAGRNSMGRGKGVACQEVVDLGQALRLFP